MKCIRIGGAVVAAAALIAGREVRGQSIELASVTEDGKPADADCFGPAVSDNGDLVAFASFATNLAADKTTAFLDVYVRERAKGTTRRVSVSSFGAEGNGNSWDPELSADGRFVVFTSDADNLIAVDNNRATDVFIHELATGATTRASRNASNKGGNGGSFFPSVSGDGRFIAFYSYATNLVSGDANGVADVFVCDDTAGTVTRVSVASDGSEANGDSYNPSISDDGRFVVFASSANDLASGDTNGEEDAFLHDLGAGTTQLVSVDMAGGPANDRSGAGMVSNDGTRVLFGSFAQDLVAGDDFGSGDVFVRDLSTGTTSVMNVDSDGAFHAGTTLSLSFAPAMSGDGRFVTLASYEDRLVPADWNGRTDLFCRDAATPLTSRLSVAFDRAEADGDTTASVLNVDGRFVAFESRASNLVPGGTTSSQIFLRERRLDAAAWHDYGMGHAGTLGVPALIASADPVVHHDVALQIDNSWGRWSVALLLLGTEQVRWPTGWGGELLVDPVTTMFLALPPGGETIGDSVPPDEFLVGLSLFAQALELDPGASEGISFTPGIELVFGY